MRGIVRAAAYLPYWRLQRASIGAFHGVGGKGTRSVASYDEDPTTMAVEAARLALAGTSVDPQVLWFSSSTPTYLEKTNATIAHAALQLSTSCAAFDMGGAVRSGIGALRAALASNTDTLVLAADVRTGLPNSPDESASGDAGAAILVGESPDLLAGYLGGSSATREFLDRWRAPGDQRTKQWEEKFAQNHYVELVGQAWTAALEQSGLAADDVDLVTIATTHARAGGAVGKQLGRPVADNLAATVGTAGAAQAALLLIAALEQASIGQIVALVALSDGADVLLFRVTGAAASARTVADQLAGGNDALPYAKYLAWRGVMSPEPPRRPEPARVSASAAGRSVDWKFGFVGSRDRESGALHMPPARVSFDGGNIDDMDPAPMAAAVGTVVTFTIDRMAYSPSPPVIFAVVDFDGGGRLPIELTDTTPEGVQVGTRVEMTFRRLNAADGIANYFWKARPIR